MAAWLRYQIGDVAKPSELAAIHSCQYDLFGYVAGDVTVATRWSMAKKYTVSPTFTILLFKVLLIIYLSTKLNCMSKNGFYPFYMILLRIY